MTPWHLNHFWTRLPAFAWLCLQASFAQAQVASLTVDLTPGTTGARGADVGNLQPLGEHLLFETRPSPEEIELWTSDGSALGTFQLPSPCLESGPDGTALLPSRSGNYFCVGPSLALPGRLALWLGDASGDTAQTLSPVEADVLPVPALAPVGRRGVLMSARDNSFGEEPWFSDGSADGTRRLADLVPGPQGSHPEAFFALATRTIFLARRAAGGTALFATDGTSAGTRLILDLGNRTLRRAASAVVGDQLFFFLNVSGLPELWVTNGTPAGTRRLRAWNDLGVFLFDRSAGLEGEFAFVLSTDALGAELWVANGSSLGTRRISDLPSLLPFAVNTAPLEVQKVGGRYVFLSLTPSLELQLWGSNGDPASTTNLLDSCFPCAPFRNPGRLVRRGQEVFFSVLDPTSGHELWVTDGTPQGTRLFFEQCAGPCGDVEELAVVAGSLYWVTTGRTPDHELWRLNDSGAARLAAFPGRFASGAPFLLDTWIAPLAGGVAFAADDLVHGTQLWWIAPGQGPVMLTAIDTGSSDSSPRPILDLGGRAVFHACTGFNTRALWSSGGTAASTERLTSEGSFGNCQFDFESIPFERVGGLAYFVPGFPQQPRSLWRTDGTPEGTRELLPLASSGLGMFAELSGLAYFSQVLGDRFELWRSDGSSAGTFATATVTSPLIQQGGQIQALAGQLYFEAFVGQENEIWASDGTSAGTQRLTVQGQPGGYLEPELTEVGGTVFFRAFRLETGFELWKTDGTPEGSEPVIDLIPGSVGSLPRRLTALGDHLLFFAESSPATLGLWSSDGTAVGTRLLHAFPPRETLLPRPVELGGRLLFAIDDGSHGFELWATDGTESGTELLADLFPGAGSSFPDVLTAAGDLAFFAAEEPGHGRELWVTDGTPEGTRRVHDLMPGPSGSNPRDLAVVANRLYFSADDGLHGRELWSLDLSADPTTCPPTDAGLCLQNNRFRVEIRWRDFQNNQGRGTPVPLTTDTGYFWFFNPTNVETIVKVLDGRPLNNHFWTFYGALSNVEYTMTVTDVQTGLTQRYFNPSRQFASVGDTESFGPNGASLDSFTAPKQSLFESHEPIVDSLFDLSKAGGCVPSSTRLCLNNSRFAVEARWTDFQGNSGVGIAEDLTADTGYFWFFRDTNVEVVLKVLDGRPLNGKFWVFYGALSNVEYTLTVTDTQTGNIKTYFNPSRRFASVGDTGAF